MGHADANLLVAWCLSLALPRLPQPCLKLQVKQHANIAAPSLVLFFFRSIGDDRALRVRRKYGKPLKAVIIMQVCNERAALRDLTAPVHWDVSKGFQKYIIMQSACGC